jgi:D-glycerate 3-kinase
VNRQLQFLAEAYRGFEQFCRIELKVSRSILANLWHFWLPLATDLARQHQVVGHPWIQGILGGQGTGKTTLCRILTWILQKWGYRVLGLSLDDLYKTYAERLRLRQQEPRLIWRGPPGTHDITLGIQTLNQILIAQPDQEILVPRFDKSCWQGAGDRTTPDRVQAIDIVLFEGWFVGVHPISDLCFATPPPPITTPDHRAFARFCNQRLREYLPLWQFLNHLLILHLPDYHLSKTWRIQAEQQLRAQGKGGMSDRETEAFVDYFWCALHPQLFIDPLVQAPPKQAPPKQAPLMSTPTPNRIVVQMGAEHQFESIV